LDPGKHPLARPYREWVRVWAQGRLIKPDLPGSDVMLRLLDKVGAEPSRAMHELIEPLLRAWTHEDELYDSATWSTELFDEFADAASDRIVTLRSFDALVNVRFPEVPYVLDSCTRVRAATESELRRFRPAARPSLGHDDVHAPSARKDDWQILEVCVSGPRKEYELSTEETRRAFVAAMALVGAPALAIHEFGEACAYRPGGLERRMGVGILPSVPMESTGYLETYETPVGWSHPTRLSIETVNWLAENWARIRAIVTDDRHFLRLPAQRLQDGLYRPNSQDAVLDFAIGLESLLTRTTRDKTTKRFAMRGAAAIGDLGQDRRAAFEGLRILYRTRSDLVHGRADEVDRYDFVANRRYGESALRWVWWWYMLRGLRSANEGISALDGLSEGTLNL